MLEKLLTLQKNSFASFSNFNVAAILITKDNSEIKGVNIESAILSSSICAERNAIFSAIAQGYSPKDFKEIHIIGGNSATVVTPPCGVCRQLILEFNPNIIVYGYNKNNKILKWPIRDLLPSAFVYKEVK